MGKVYCVFREDIIQMSYEVETLDKVFRTREEAESYIKEVSKYSEYKRYIKEVRLGNNGE